MVAIVRNAGLIMLEAVLPLTALFSAGIVFNRLKREGALIALESMGTRPRALVWPLLPWAYSARYLQVYWRLTWYQKPLKNCVGS